MSRTTPASTKEKKSVYFFLGGESVAWEKKKTKKKKKLNKKSVPKSTVFPGEGSSDLKLAYTHSSVFPTAIITFCDSLLKGLNGLNVWCCCGSLWSACRWRWFSIFCFKFWTLTPCDRFTVEFGTPGIVEINVLLVRCTVDLVVRVKWCNVTMLTNCSLPMCVLALDFTSSPIPSWACLTRMSSDSFTEFPVSSEESHSLCKRLSSISCEWDVFLSSTKTRSESSGFTNRSQIGLCVLVGLVWRV